MVFELRAELSGHLHDVRTVCSIGDDRLATASRDQTIKIWSWSSVTKSFEIEQTISDHEDYVFALLLVGDQLFSASRDKTIRMHNVNAPGGAGKIWRGHDDTVCSLAAAPNGDIVSSSWDKTVRVWRNNQCVATWQGHAAAVWCVAVLPDGSVLSGSADRTIRQWTLEGGCVCVYRGHEDCVRAIRSVGSSQFISTSNDGAVKHWTVGKDSPVESFFAHDQYAYDLDFLPNGHLLTASEDRTVREWNNKVAVQSLVHPSGVWCVAHLPNGDIVSGCQDGVARVWTSSPERMAAKDIREAYQASVASQQISTKMVGNINIRALPGVESLSQPGNRDGEQKIVSNGETAEVYLWSAAEGRWTKLGDVVDGGADGGGCADSISTGTNNVIDGVKYDMTFAVDLDGTGNKRIGYNAGDDHYQVAQQFIWKHELSQEHLDQIARFLIQNTQHLGPARVAAGAADPMGGRYMPSVGMGGMGGMGPADPSMNPFGGSRYVPESGSSTSTGAPNSFATSRYTPGETPSQPSAPTSQYIPPDAAVAFRAGKVDLILNKLKEVNAALGDSPSALSPEEQQTLEALVSACQTQAAVPATASLLLRKLLTWPREHAFAVIDLARLCILNKSMAAQVHHGDHGWPLLQGVLEAGGWVPNLCQNASPQQSQFLALRFAANMFCDNSLLPVLSVRILDILDAVSTASLSDNPRVLTPFVTLMLNAALLAAGRLGHSMHDPAIGEVVRQKCLNFVIPVLSNTQDVEVRFRAVVAAGTCIFKDSETAKLASSLGVRDAIEQIRVASEGKLQAAADEVSRMIPA